MAIDWTLEKDPLARDLDLVLGLILVRDRELSVNDESTSETVPARVSNGSSLFKVSALENDSLERDLERALGLVFLLPLVGNCVSEETAFVNVSSIEGCSFCKLFLEIGLLERFVNGLEILASCCFTTEGKEPNVLNSNFSSKEP